MYGTLPLLSLLGAVFILQPCAAVPLSRGHVLQPRQDLTLETLAVELPGINFAQAFTDWNDIRKIAHIVRALEDVHLLTDATIPTPHGDDPSFLAYFGQGYIGAKGKFFNIIFDNLRLAGGFPRKGNGRTGLENQVTIRGKDIAGRCPRGPTAYTAAQGPGQPTPFIVICDVYWTKIDQGKLDHVFEKLLDRPSTNIWNLVTQEQVLLHELMHRIDGLFPGSDISPIIDVKAHLDDGDLFAPSLVSPWIPVYGPVRCKKLAASKSPSASVRVNADNYAWFATSYFFSHKWGLSITETAETSSLLADNVLLDDDVPAQCEDSDGDEATCYAVNDVPTCTTDPETGDVVCVL